MGAPLTEFVLETVLRDGLGDLRANPDKLDDLFSRFMQAQFINQYGQTQIDRLKTYIQNNQIRIVQAWSLVPTSMPCYSIQMIRSDETPDDQQFSDEYLDEDTSIEPEIRIADVTPLSYDTVSGKLIIANTVDLSTVCPGMLFVDNAGNKFEIGSGNSNLSGNKYINIGSGKEPDLSDVGSITSNIQIERMERGMIRLRETLTIGCHSNNDVHLTKYLYYILMYILKSRNDSLINRGIHLARGTGGVFDRADEYKGENVFSRFMDVNCLSEFKWDKDLATLIDCFDTTIKTNTPNPDSKAAAKYNTSPDE